MKILAHRGDRGNFMPDVMLIVISLKAISRTIRMRLNPAFPCTVDLNDRQHYFTDAWIL
jgi:hypothetical protein